MNVKELILDFNHFDITRVEGGLLHIIGAHDDGDMILDIEDDIGPSDRWYPAALKVIEQREHDVAQAPAKT
jgi:hypothetical protein